MKDAATIVQRMTLEEKAAFCSGSDFWYTKPIERLGIPAVMMCDGPHGLRKQEGQGDHLGLGKSIETVCYPTASALASSFDRDVMKKLGSALGQECQAEQVPMLLGPGLNMKRSPLCGRNFEYFSEDPYLAGEMGAAYIQALQAEGVASCVKHFACNNQETRRMSGDSRLDERTLHEIYLPAFEAAVKKGRTRGIMCAYNAVNGTFCSENKMLLTDILHGKWGYDGFVVTDWGAMKGRAEGVAAGLDLEMPGSVLSTGEEIVAAVKSGKLAESDLDRAVQNILRFVLDAVANQKEGATVDRAANRTLSRELSAECAVLLKNEGILPLSAEKKVAFIGEFAEEPRYQGSGSSHVIVAGVAGARDSAASTGKNIVYARGYVSRSDVSDPALIAEAVEAAKSADVAVVFAGLPDSFESEGCDRESMKMPANQNALISAVSKVNPNTVVVLHGGAPMELPWSGEVSAILCMYLGGEQVGAAAVELLYGEKNPSGHLAETWPVKLADNPAHLNFPGEDGIATYSEGIFIGYRYYDKKEMNVAFPFGHGLSYTSFSYENLRVDKEALRDTDTLTVQCDVINTGNCAGKTVAQLYIRDVESTVRRPIRELKGFEKISLESGEGKTVTFTLDKRAFAYYEPKCADWFVESGEFVIEIGASSRDIRQSVSVQVTGTMMLPFTVDKNTTIGQLMKHPKSAAFLQQMMAEAAAKTGEIDAVSAMGDGANKMVENMMMEMPLGAMVNYGQATTEQLEGIIAMLNSQVEV